MCTVGPSPAPALFAPPNAWCQPAHPTQSLANILVVCWSSSSSSSPARTFGHRLGRSSYVKAKGRPRQPPLWPKRRCRACVAAWLGWRRCRHQAHDVLAHGLTGGVVHRYHGRVRQVAAVRSHRRGPTHARRWRRARSHGCRIVTRVAVADGQRHGRAVGAVGAARGGERAKHHGVALVVVV